MIEVPPMPITDQEFLAAIGRVKRGGSAGMGRPLRLARIEQHRDIFRNVADQLATGAFRWSAVHQRRLDNKRTVAELALSDGFVVAMLVNRLSRFPNLPEYFRISYAYAVPERGPQVAVDTAWNMARHLSSRYDGVSAITFDIKQAFATTDPFIGICRLRAVGFDREACDVSNTLYTHLHSDGRFPGIATGPAVSPLVYEAAIWLLDSILQSEFHNVIRYSDNIVALAPNYRDERCLRSTLDDCIARYNRIVGANIRIHKVQTSTYSEKVGWSAPLYFLGFRFEGLNLMPADGKIRKVVRRYIDLHKSNSVASALATFRGAVNYYGPVVDPHSTPGGPHYIDLFFEEFMKQSHQLYLTSGEPMPNTLLRWLWDKTPPQ